MSRVGVRTLVTWYRTKPLCKLNKSSYNTSFKWKYSKSLYVYLYKDHYLISCVIDKHITIELSQQLYIDLLYVDCSGPGEFEVFKINYTTKTCNLAIQLVENLLQIPVTDIFTMFPIIIEMIMHTKD